MKTGLYTQTKKLDFQEGGYWLYDHCEARMNLAERFLECP